MSVLKNRSHRYCSVPQCKSKSANRISMFLFPKDEKMKEKWAEILKIEKKSKNMNVCSLHFVKNDFILPNVRRARPNLKKGVIPSQNLPSDTKFIKLNRNEIEMSENNITDMEGSIDLYLEESKGKKGELGNNSTSVTLNQASSSVILDETLGVSEVKQKFDNLAKSETAAVAHHEVDIDSLNLSFLKKDFPNLDTTMDSNESNKIIHGCISSKLSRLKSILENVKNKTKILNDLSERGEFIFIEEYLLKLTKEFLNLQMKNLDWDSYLKNWTIKQKKLALSLYNCSPSLYSYLLKYFELPSKPCLMSLKSYFDRGNNKAFITHLGIQVNKLIMPERNCVLLIGDMPLATHCKPTETIMNQTICGHGQTDEAPERCLVFMAKGIQRKWHQIVAYFFISSSVTTAIIKLLILEVIQQLQRIDLKIVATVCNQESRNCAALKCLIEEDYDDFSYLFRVDSRPVCVIYDVPNLLKSTRNALIRCFFKFQEDKIANFDFIQNAFDLDQLRTYKQLDKLKKEYFNFEDDEIMADVEIAARQLSYSVAVSIESHLPPKKVALPSEAFHTAEFAHDMDCLFDSLNGSNSPVPRAKPFKGVLQKGSPHMNLWLRMLKEIPSWQLLDKKDGSDVTGQYEFIQGWQTVIKSIIFIWDDLGKRGFKYLCLRSFNQELLECAFHYIRQNNAGGPPTADQFVVNLNRVMMYKTLPVDDTDDEVEKHENLYYLINIPNKINQHHSIVTKRNSSNFLYFIEK